MSNRNHSSKSPQKPANKELMKYLIMQKMTKPPAPCQVTKTQPDEEEIEDFKKDIEMKYRACQMNRTYRFPFEEHDNSSDGSLDSLIDVEVYNLNVMEKLIDATQPQFIKALNEKLMNIPSPKSNRKSTESNNRIQEGSIQKPHKTRQISTDKKVIPSQIQQLLRLTHQSKTRYNNIYIPSTYQPSNIQHANNKKIDIRIKTENDEHIDVSQFKVLKQKQPSDYKPKLRESMRLKKDGNLKLLNFTLDTLESLGVTRLNKSQNKSYKC